MGIYYGAGDAFTSAKFEEIKTMDCFRRGASGTVVKEYRSKRFHSVLCRTHLLEVFFAGDGRETFREVSTSLWWTHVE